MPFTGIPTMLFLLSEAVEGCIQHLLLLFMAWAVLLEPP